jgi:hypothetical protein
LDFIEKAGVKNSAPAFWDPKALQRVHYPQKNNQAVNTPITSIMKAQTEQYAKEYYRAETVKTSDQLGLSALMDSKLINEDQANQSPQGTSSTFNGQVAHVEIKEECYNLQYPANETAADLKGAYENVTDYILVTVWFDNYQNQWGQNLFNQDVRGTLWKLICKYHTNVIYTEADMSLYNNDISNYRKLADQLKLDLTNLYQGPTVLVMHNQYGEAFRTAKGPRDLVTVVDDYLTQKEISDFHADVPEYDIQNEVLAMNHYDYYMPSKDVEDYRPLKDENGNEIKTPLRQSVHMRPVSGPVYDY